jgi:hypothetical protein
MNVCHFCGPTEVELTKEELWPKWYSKKLVKRRGKKKLEARRTMSDDRIKSWTPIKPDAALGGVCKKCNNELLSELENDYFKPVFERMTSQSAVEFTLDDQVTLAAWITRFAMIFDLARGLAAVHGPFFSPQERKNFIDKFEPPDGAWIWLGSMRGGPPASTFATNISFDDGSTGFTCSGVMDRLAFQFLFRRWSEPPPSEARVSAAMAPVLRRFGSATVQIWPVIWKVAKWPMLEYFGYDEFKTFATRWDGLSWPPDTT